jgi:hypothetical protein
MEVSMCYTDYAFIAESTGAAAADTLDSSTPVMLLLGSSRGGDAAAGRALLTEGLKKKPKENDSACSRTPRFVNIELPAKAASFVAHYVIDIAKEFVVLSAFPEREFLQCVEHFPFHLSSSRNSTTSTSTACASQGSPKYRSPTSRCASRTTSVRL